MNHAAEKNAPEISGAALKVSSPFAPSLYWGVGLLMLLLIALPVRAALFATGLRWLYILLFSSFVSFLLTAAVRRFALYRGAIDLPGPMKVHTLPTPRLGGVAVYLAVLGAIATNAVVSEGMVAIIVGGSIIALVGYLDDLKGIPPLPKLIAQGAAALVVVASGKMITLFSGGLLGNAANLFLTLLWIIGITNALNFFDGMDGLAAGLSMIVAFFLGIVAYQTDQPYLAWMAVAIFGASLGFLPYNFRPGGAVIFLGDSGSTFLGFTLAALAVKGNWADLNPIVSLSNPILIFGVLIYDMIYITLSRIALGKVRTFHEWLAYVGHDHLHHRLATLLGSRRAAVATIFLISGSLGTAAIVLRRAGTFEAFLLLFQAALFLGVVTILEIMANRRNGAGSISKQERSDNG